jgi:hypothetical protein
MSHPHPLVEEIREKLAKITPGDWRTFDGCIVAEDETHAVCFGHDYDDYGGVGDADAEFIAAAPRLLREALSYIEALEQKELTKMKDELSLGSTAKQSPDGPSPRLDIVDAHAATVAMFGSTAARQAADYMAEWLLSSVRNGVALIASERDRQVRSEGWTPEHDDEHENGELISAAVWYADNGCEFDLGLRLPPWPFEPEAWKASDDRVGQLVKAGALIAAEIDRLQRRDGPRDVDGGHLKPSTSAEPSNTKAFSESRETALREALQRVTLDPDDFIGTVWQRAEGGAVFLSQHTGRAITLDDYKAARAALSLPAAPREGE